MERTTFLECNQEQALIRNSNENFAKSQNHEIEKTERYYCHKHPRDCKTFRANEEEKSREGPHRK